MLDHDDAAIAPFRALEGHFAVARGANRRATLGRVVDALVGTPFFQYRVVTLGGEARADAGEVYGRAQELLAQALAVRAVVFGAVAFRVGVADGAVDLAVVDELGGENFTVLDLFTVTVDLLVMQLEAVALANIQRKIDVPAEDAGQLHDDVFGDVGFVGRHEQR